MANASVTHKALSPPDCSVASYSVIDNNCKDVCACKLVELLPMKFVLATTSLHYHSRGQFILTGKKQNLKRF